MVEDIKRLLTAGTGENLKVINTAYDMLNHYENDPRGHMAVAIESMALSVITQTKGKKKQSGYTKTSEGYFNHYVLQLPREGKILVRLHT